MSTWPGEDGYGDTKGWDRASIAFNSRRAYRPNISSDDLRLPNEPGILRTVAVCSVCAFCFTILYVGFPLWGVSLLVDLGIWFPAALVGTMVTMTAFFVGWSLHEDRGFRRLAREL